MISSCDRAQARHYADATRRYFAVSQVIDVLVGQRTYPPDAARAAYQRIASWLAQRAKKGGKR